MAKRELTRIEKTVEIIFRATDKGVLSTLGPYGAGLDKVSQMAEAAARQIDRLNKVVFESEAAFAAAAAAVGVFAVKEAGKFEAAFNEVESLLTRAPHNVDAYRESVLKYVEASKLGLEDIGEALYQTISLGVDYKDALDVMGVSEQLAVAGRSTLTQSTELLIRTMRAYGEEMDQAQKYSDAFFLTVQNGQTTIPELSNSIANVTTIAKAAHIPIEEVSAAVAGLTVEGFDTDVAVTSLAQAIKSILDPSKQAAENAEELGLDFSAAGLKANGLYGTLKQVAEVTQLDADKTKLLFEDTRALRAVLTLAADSSGMFSQTLKDIADSAGITADAYKVMAGNFELVNNQILNNVRVTLIRAGLPLLDEYKRGAEAIVGVFQRIGTAINADTFDTVYRVLEGVIDRAITLAEDFGKALEEVLTSPRVQTAISDMMFDFRDLFDAVVDFFGLEALADPGRLEEAIIDVTNAIGGMQQYIIGFMERVEPYYNTILAIIRAFGDANAAAQASLGGVGGIAKVATILGPGKTSLLELAMAAGEITAKLASLVPSAPTPAPLTFAASHAAGPAAPFSWPTAGGGSAISNRSLLEAAARAAAIDAHAASYEEAFAKVAEGAVVTSAAIDSVGQSMTNLDAVSLGSVEGLGYAAEIAARNTLSLAGETLGLAAGADLTQTKLELLEAKTAALAKSQAGQKAQTEELAKSTGIYGGVLNDLSLQKYKIDVDLQAAKVTGDVDIIEAALLSLDAVTRSTGDVLLTLYSQLGAAVSSGQSNLAQLIQRQIAEEERRRAEAHKKEMALIDARLAFENSRMQRLTAGGGLITVDTTGLDPALDAIMRTIIDRVQIQANAVAADFLLGIS